MSLDFDPLYLIWLFVALSAALTAEAVYVLCFSTASYRTQINRRLMLAKDHRDRESVLNVLRRQRGLNEQGGYRSKFQAFNRLVLQSGITVGLTRLLVVIVVISIVVFGGTMWLRNPIESAAAGVLSATVLPYLVLRFLRARRQKKFSGQFPNALDTIVRSLRAGHPVPVAIAITNSSGQQLYGTTLNATAGQNTWTWNGDNNAGSQLPDGAYTIGIVSSGSNGTTTALPFTVTGTATGVQSLSSGMQLEIGALTVPFSAVQSVGN